MKNRALTITGVCIIIIVIVAISAMLFSNKSKPKEETPPLLVDTSCQDPSWIKQAKEVIDNEDVAKVIEIASQNLDYNNSNCRYFAAWYSYFVGDFETALSYLKTVNDTQIEYGDISKLQDTIQEALAQQQVDGEATNDSENEAETDAKISWGESDDQQEGNQ